MNGKLIHYTSNIQSDYDPTSEVGLKFLVPVYNDIRSQRFLFDDGDMPPFDEFVQNHLKALDKWLEPANQSKRIMSSSGDDNTVNLKRATVDKIVQAVQANIGDELQHVTYKLAWSGVQAPGQPKDIDVWARFSLVNVDERSRPQKRAYVIQSYMTCHDCNQEIQRRCGKCGKAGEKIIRKAIDSY
jgi:hypothetical protein